MLYWGNREPLLSEVLSDPIVHLLMARDGERLDEVLVQLLAVWNRLSAQEARLDAHDRLRFASARRGDHQQEDAVPDTPDPSYILLGTLGQLRAHRHGLFGFCNDCGNRYCKDVPAERRVRSLFDVDVDALIAERGANCRVVGLAPVPCPRCGGRNTASRITAPSRPR